MELEGLKCFPLSPSFYDFVPSMLSDVTYFFPPPSCCNSVYASFTHTIIGVCPLNRSLTPKGFLVMLDVAMAPGQLLCEVLLCLSWTRELAAHESPVKSLGTPSSWHLCTMSHHPRLTEEWQQVVHTHGPSISTHILAIHRSGISAVEKSSQALAPELGHYTLAQEPKLTGKHFTSFLSSVPEIALRWRKKSKRWIQANRPLVTKVARLSPLKLIGKLTWVVLYRDMESKGFISVLFANLLFSNFSHK